MSVTENILKVLKRLMRSKGITYKLAAEALELSEVSIKRLFAERSFSLLRLEKLCELAGTDLAELIQLAEAQQQHTDQLSLQQEQELVSSPALLLVAVCLINHMSFEDILHKYDFKNHELIRLLAKLDRLDVIELLPANRYRLKLSRRFSLQPNGPVQQFFINNMLNEFITHDVNQDKAPFQLAWGMLSKESVKELHNKIQRLIEEYLQIAEHDRRIPPEDKLTSSLFVMFHEDMEPALFKKQWKQPASR